MGTIEEGIAKTHELSLVWRRLPWEWFGCSQDGDSSVSSHAVDYLLEEGYDDWRVVAWKRAIYLMKDSGLWWEL